MPTTDLGADLLKLQSLAAEIASKVLAPNAARVDHDAAWPAEGMSALARASLMGLHVPRRLGGHEQGMLALSVITEELGRACGSTAMCFGMHSIAAKVLAAKATPDQEERFLRPIAEGRHITSLALSEPGTGAHFFLPRATFLAEGEDYLLNGEKSFVTNGGHADSYVVSAVPPGAELDPGAFTCLAVMADTPGLEWRPAWNGYGMRGNSSQPLGLNQARVANDNVLGAQGDQIWFVFEVIAPYFLTAMAGVYLGIARAALEAAIDHLKSRRHSHTGAALSDLSALWPEVAEAWTEIEATRQLVRHAARLGDAGAEGAPRALFAAKAKVAKTVNAVTETAMILMGGRGYAENSQITRLHRDARAANVMSPTSHLLRTWLGRSLLDLPIL